MGWLKTLFGKHKDFPDANDYESLSDTYDYESYSKSLEITLELAVKDYWAQYSDINKHQVNVAKTYLWVSAALLGAYAAGYDRYSESLMQSGFILLFALLSLVSVIVAFGLCIYAIPARKGYSAIPDTSWGEFSQKSHEFLSNKTGNAYCRILSELVDKTDSATSHNLKTNNERAKILRLISWVLIASFSFAVLTVLAALLDNYVSNMNQTSSSIEEHTHMTKKTTPQSGQNPNVPKPAGPISSGERVRNTSSVNRITESKTDKPKER